MYLSLHYHHHNDSCVEMGSDESHFNVSIIVRDKVTRQCPQTTTFLKRRETETESSRDPSVYQPNALSLGQTGALKSSKIYQQQHLSYVFHREGSRQPVLLWGSIRTDNYADENSAKGC